MPPVKHALIMGAGIGGPAAALSLARRGIKSTIFEIRPTPSTSGGSITLAANALRALTQCAGESVYDKLKNIGYVYEKMAMTGDDGYHYGDLFVGETDGYPALRIMRNDLHQVLLETCKEVGVEVLFGKKVKDIEEKENEIELRFEDGHRATGDILIGADGIHSQARRQVLGDAAPEPVFSHTCVVNGFVPRSQVTTPTSGYHFPAVIANPSGFIMVIPIDPKGEKLAFGINTSIDEEKTRDGWDAYRDSGEAARYAKSGYDNIRTQPIRSLLDEIDETAVQLWAPYSIPTLSTWHRGRTCLIGDSGHALPPNGQVRLM